MPAAAARPPRSWTEFARYSPVVKAQIGFFIQREGTVIEIGGADCGPDAIHQHRLLMQHGGAELVDFDTGFEQAPV